MGHTAGVALVGLAHCVAAVVWVKLVVSILISNWALRHLILILSLFIIIWINQAVFRKHASPLETTLTLVIALLHRQSFLGLLRLILTVLQIEKMR